MAGRPAGAARGREGADAAQRRAGPAPAGAAVGPDRRGVPLRDRPGPGVTRRSLRRPLAAARLPLHVRARVHGRVPVLLGDRGRLQRLGRPPRESRRHAVRGVAGPARETAGVQAADGLELPLGVLVRQRLQLRLPGVADHRAAAGRNGRVQLRRVRHAVTAGGRPGRSLGRRVRRGHGNGLGDIPAGRARHKRVRARGRRRLPHLLGVRARNRRPLGHVPVARPRATRAQRSRPWWRRHDEYGSE